jgi:chemotaxis protein CheD
LNQYFLKPGYIYVPTIPTVISTVLGSCVAVCLWDTKQECGGMNHFLYPFTRNPDKATAQYGNVATTTLIRLMLDEGSSKKALEAQIFGGACPDRGPSEAVEISRKNIAVAQRILCKNGIPIVSEDVGGNKGRKVIYNTLDNEVMSVKVGRLRESDWHPYNATNSTDK